MFHGLRRQNVRETKDDDEPDAEVHRGVTMWIFHNKPGLRMTKAREDNFMRSGLTQLNPSNALNKLKKGCVLQKKPKLALFQKANMQFSLILGLFFVNCVTPDDKNI